MSILIQTTHIYSAIVYLHHGTCTTFHSLTNDNIRSFFFGNPKLLDPVLDGRHVYTDLLVGYPITDHEERQTFLQSMSVHQSNLDCRLKHIFEPCGQNKWLLRISIYRFVTKTTLNNSNMSIAMWLLNEKPIPTVQASWETVRKLC